MFLKDFKDSGGVSKKHNFTLSSEDGNDSNVYKNICFVWFSYSNKVEATLPHQMW